MAHIGLIKALQEQEIGISAISGTSIGAIVGALHGSGKNIDEMLDFFRTIPLFKYNFLTWSKPGLLDTERYYNMFKKGIPNDDFSKLECKLYVIATNLEKGEPVIFDNGPLIRPVLASAALPPYFSPVKIDETLFADGG
ncbi:MAG: patatin-like phospholipase family protein, partial [Flavobacteriaceae bacterium]|nr:patatin-like phospholipase family protein [Flavobacteriaceae bacterium]